MNSEVATNWLVIPCYNEAERINPENVGRLLTDERVRVLLVNDGSSDDTWNVLRKIGDDLGDRVDVLGMMSNLGKAEAVRRGMNHCIAAGAEVVGYLDADFSTPADEMHRLLNILDGSRDIKVVLGARWLRLGANIVRSATRQYIGRVFATLASYMLRMPVYDTQCGAKVFEVTDNLKSALAEPFMSRWAFDVELLGRLREGVHGGGGYAMENFIEIPLDTWINVAGSKVGIRDAFVVAFEMIGIARYLRRLRNS
ncbi:MAG: glycosyltransferase [Pseudomonadales bacterium]|nr:glycosyltransferase [Pseudomonadales bacterium]